MSEFRCPNVLLTLRLPLRARGETRRVRIQDDASLCELSFLVESAALVFLRFGGGFFAFECADVAAEGFDFFVVVFAMFC